MAETKYQRHMKVRQEVKGEVIAELIDHLGTGGCMVLRQVLIQPIRQWAMEQGIELPKPKARVGSCVTKPDIFDPLFQDSDRSLRTPACSG